MSLAPKPLARAGRVRLWRHFRMFRSDILSAQPERLFEAKMAEFRLPLLRSFLVNEPDLIHEVLRARPGDFPKSSRVQAALRPLLGRSVFLSNGATWARQRRMIDPAFDAGRVKASLPAMEAAARAMVGRLQAGPVEAEELASHAAADVIFRALFSVPIEDAAAASVHRAFRAHQRAQPVASLAALIPWWPASARVRGTARIIRGLIAAMVAARALEIDRGCAPADLATGLMQAGFDAAETVDQVAIFFLAGHETSAAMLGWALYLLATHPDEQARVAAEADTYLADPGLAALSRMPFTRDVLRETLRLYPPVPMLVREAARPEVFRKRPVPKGAQVVISPWHLQRSARFWEDPDAFRPARWATAAGRAAARSAWLPFSAGPRVCPGAGFALAEGAVLLAHLLAAFRLAPEGDAPVPVAHLTLRSRDGIGLRLQPR